MLAEYYAGVIIPHKEYMLSLFQNHYLKSLTEFVGYPSYAYSLLFLEYLEHRFGNIKSENNINRSKYIDLLYATPNTGIQAIEYATGIEFNQLFADFVQMILVNGRNITTNPKYEIPALNNPKISGYNLKEIIDTTFRLHSRNGKINKHNLESITTNLLPYSFILTKWHNKIYSFDFNKDINTFGSYIHVKK